MRVLLNRQEDTRGAVAFIIALLSAVLLLIAGFVADFGVAYASKRQLQTAADSAALAAASVYTNYPGTCAELLANTEARTKAQVKADSYRTQNRKGASGSPIEVNCSAKGLQVVVDAAASTTSLFGGLAGAGARISAERSAAASVEVSKSAGTGFRPMAVCSADLPDGGAITGHVVRINAPGNGGSGPAACPGAGGPGNWWTVDCPEERQGKTGLLEEQIRYGCDDPVRIIDGQGGQSGEGLALVLTGECDDVELHDENCLSGDPGQLDSGHIEASWQHLIGASTRIVLPIFYGCPAGVCSTDTTPGTGTNTIFPVHKLAGMFICGYHFGKNVTFQPDTNPACVSGNVHNYEVTADKTSDSYLLVVYQTVQTSGGTRSPECDLGDVTCDGGTRGVRLTR